MAAIVEERVLKNLCVRNGGPVAALINQLQGDLPTWRVLGDACAQAFASGGGLR